MTYPSGVQTATLTFSNPGTFTGASADSVTMTVASTASVVWQSTGEPIDNFTEVTTPGPGLPGSLTVPLVDQAGFIDGTGNAFSMWAYQLTRRASFGGQVKVVTKNWQPIAGQTTIDFDDLPGGPIGLPVSVPASPVTSVAGLTGAVDGTALVGALPLDAATAANITTPASATAAVLNATYASSRVVTLGGRWWFDGDSISSAGSGLEWIQATAAKSGGRLILVGSSGVPGRPTSQALIDFSTNIVPQAGLIDVVCYEEMTHSISAGLTVAQFLAELDSYHALVRGVGAQLVVTSGFPNSAMAATMATWNRALTAWGNAKSVPILPIYTLADPATGSYPTGWSTDGTHPNPKGLADQAISELILAFLDPLLGGPVAPVLGFQGDGLFSNGMLTSVSAPITGAVSAATPTQVTGTLPAGTYSYIFSTWGYGGPGHSVNKIVAGTTLAAAGGISFALTYTGLLSKILVYRKGPSDASYFMLTAITPASTWADTGSLTPTTAVWADGEYSQYPAGVSFGGGVVPRDTRHAPFIFTEVGTRGNIFREVDNYAIVTLSSALTPGSQVHVSFKTRTIYPSGAAFPLSVNPYSAQIQWTGGTTGGVRTNVPGAPDLSGKWQLFYGLFTVPGDRTGMNLVLQASQAAGVYIDIAEILVAQV